MDEVSTTVLPSTYIPEAIPIEGRFPVVIPGSELEEFVLVPLQIDPQARLPDLLANRLPSVLTRKRICVLARDFNIPFEMHPMVPREIDLSLTLPGRVLHRIRGTT